jgi:formate--tetrahydrofolate ligase
MTDVPSDIDIAQAATKHPISDVAAKLKLEPNDIIPFGHDKAKNSERSMATMTAI